MKTLTCLKTDFDDPLYITACLIAYVNRCMQPRGKLCNIHRRYTHVLRRLHSAQVHSVI